MTMRRFLLDNDGSNITYNLGEDVTGAVEEVWAKRAIITEFMVQVSAILRDTDRRILFGARVPTTPAGCRRLGFDLEAWAGGNLMDLVVVCPFLTTNWRIPFRDFHGVCGSVLAQGRAPKTRGLSDIQN